MAESVVVPLLEIKEEFGTCEICLEYYDDGDKLPRILPCHHTICCQCLKSIWKKSPDGVKCPNCRQVWPVHTTIETSFQQNKILINLVEYIKMKNTPGNLMCHDCPDNSNATVRCLDCQQYMCDSCTIWHTKYLKEHTSVLISELVNMPQEEFFRQKETCKQHKPMKLDLFCITCTEAVCSSCAHVSHKDHDISNLEDVYNEKKELTRTTLNNLQASSEESKAYHDKLVAENEQLNKMKQIHLQDIEDFSNKIIEQVKYKAGQLKEEVNANVARQQADRNRQLEMISQSEGVKSQHVLNCRQALSYARVVDFIEMSQDLENKSKTLMKGPNLTDLTINAERPSLKTFEDMNAILEKSASVSRELDMSQLRTCIEITDAKTGYDSGVIKVTLLPRDNTVEDPLVMIRATIELINEDKVEHVKVPPAVVGNVVYKAASTGPHRAFINVNGCNLTNNAIVFDSKDTDAELTRKILFSVDGQPGNYLELFLPSVEFNKGSINMEWCSLNEKDKLVNRSLAAPKSDLQAVLDLFHGVSHSSPAHQYDTSDKQDLPPGVHRSSRTPKVKLLPWFWTSSSTSQSDDRARLKVLPGVTANTAIPARGRSYWETNIDCKVLEETRSGYAAALIGLCTQGHYDDETLMFNNKRMWCAGVGSCKQHNSLCLKVYSCGRLQCDIPIIPFKKYSVLNLTIGMLRDAHKHKLHFIDVNAKKLLHSIEDIKLSQTLMPVFAVYYFEVTLGVLSGTDITVDEELQTLLSSLVQT